MRGINKSRVFAGAWVARWLQWGLRHDTQAEKGSRVPHQKMCAISALVACAVLGAPAFAQTSTTLYKSTGPDGKTIYSDRPPPSARAAKTLTFQNQPASALSPETLAYIAQLKKSADKPADATPPRETVLFSATWCGYCKKAKAYLASKHTPYREFDIDTKDGVAAFARAGGKSGVPLLVVDGMRVTGFSVASYDAIFDPRK